MKCNKVLEKFDGQFVKAWSAKNPKQKLLIIDSDIETPGLTWLMDEEGERQSQISYLDLLEIAQSSELNDKNKEQFEGQK